MRISIPVRLKPEGGGNYFLLNFLTYLDRQGIPHTAELSDRYDVLFTSHWLVPPKDIQQAARRNPALRLVHRIDGAAQDYGRDPEADAVQRQVNAMADLTIFQSQYCRRSTRETFPVIVHDGPVIYNPVDTEQFRPDGERLEFPEDVTVCCVTWSTNPKKGLRGVYDVARANPQVGFLLCGRFPEAPRRPNIHVLGILDREELATVMRSCDVLLTFSENEACPNVVLEAMASGLPVLYKASGATPELVAECGLPTEVWNFRGQLDQVMAHRSSLARLARERTLTQFTPERVFSRYLAEIQRALERPPIDKRARRGGGQGPLTNGAAQSTKTATLVVFLTRGLSLRQWEQAGLLEREVALYRALAPQVGRILFLTYGDAGDLTYQSRWAGIGVLCNRWGFPGWLYRWLVPFLYWRELAHADVFKTNQTHGSELLLWVRRFHRRARVIARSGYVWSLNAARAAHGRWSYEHARAKRRERALFAKADRVVVTTELAKSYCLDAYRVPAKRIRVIPNYVLTELFLNVPRPSVGGRRLLFVGRLHAEKNLAALLEAVGPLDVELALIGEGPLRESLERTARTLRARVRFLGLRPHHALPEEFSRADLFILPSLYENHPKALLEAMACGVPVIGTDVPGIRELIVHRQTGYVCGTSPEAIRAAILEVLDDPALQAAMGRRARQVIVEQCSLERIAEQELALLRELGLLRAPAESLAVSRA